MAEPEEKSIEDVILRDGRYPLAAYAFLKDGLNHAVKTVHGQEPTGLGQQHVTGQQLCNALRDLAIMRYGHLAQAVLAKWNIRGTIDFGSMVYLLIENDLMKKTAEDSLEDFRDVYDFEQAFKLSDEFELKE